AVNVPIGRNQWSGGRFGHRPRRRLEVHWPLARVRPDMQWPVRRERGRWPKRPPLHWSLAWRMSGVGCPLMVRYQRYVAIGDSTSEGLDDPDDAGGYRGWANRLAERIAREQ